MLKWNISTWIGHGGKSDNTFNGGLKPYSFYSEGVIIASSYSELLW